MGIFKLAVCQMNVTDDKKQNIAKACELLRTAADQGAVLAVLPEMFNCPYENSRFAAYAEELGTGETVQAISKLAGELGIYVVAGSIPELDAGKLYNTSIIFDSKGKAIGKHRKMHLFDIDVKGSLTFRESDTLAAGNEVTVADTGFCTIGVAICYDMRFPELMRLMAVRGADLLVVPAAFNMVTGPAHWETLLRARAIDNQVYMAAASPARNTEASYIAYGNSMVVDPWGRIISRAGEKEEIIYADIDQALVEKVRNELPLLKHRRTDIYILEEK